MKVVWHILVAQPTRSFGVCSDLGESLFKLLVVSGKKLIATAHHHHGASGSVLLVQRSDQSQQFTHDKQILSTSQGWLERGSPQAI